MKPPTQIEIDYNDCMARYRYYKDCIYEECMVGIKTADGKIHFADKYRSKILEEKAKKFKEKADSIKDKNAEYFI